MSEAAIQEQPTIASAPPPAAPAAPTQQTPPAAPAQAATPPATPATTAPAPAGDPPPYWPNDWRERVAKDFAGDDEKRLKAELDRLAKIESPAAAYRMYRGIE